MTIKNNVTMTQRKVSQLNLISLFKPHQSIDVTIIAILSLNLLTIIRFQNCTIFMAQLAKNHI
jgi:hypothetical protein